jgi:hypothetical protein
MFFGAASDIVFNLRSIPSAVTRAWMKWLE